MSVLEVDELVQHFPIAGSKSVVRAVNGVSFSLDKGETLALVGESGSGKTTIGRCVLGLIQPTSGRIDFRGVEMGGGGARCVRRSFAASCSSCSRNRRNHSIRGCGCSN